MEKKKNIVLVLLFIIIAVMACFGVKMSKEIFELKQSNQNIKQNNNQGQQEVIPQEQQTTNNNQSNIFDNTTNNNINEEKELTDVYIKKDISKKASMMLSLGLSKTEDAMVEYDHASDLKIINLTNNEKLGIVLTASDDFVKLNPADVQNKVPTIFKNDNLNGKITETEFASDDELRPYIIDGSIIEKDYIELFNSSLTKPTSINNNLGICPFYLYDTATNVYMTSYVCGGTCYPSNYLNKYKYTIKGNNIFVYVAAASVRKCDGNKTYKDIGAEDKNYLYTATSDEQVKNDLKANPQKYSQYKLTFEKNEYGTYYYKTTEKIN